MKRWLLKAMVAGIFLIGVMGAVARAQDGGNEGCSDATLRGDYAFTVSGTIWVYDPQGVLEAVQRDGIAMTHFDGTGGLSQVDYVLSGHNNLPAPGSSSRPGDRVQYGRERDVQGVFRLHRNVYD
jgi:hypothetical protein